MICRIYLDILFSTEAAAGSSDQVDLFEQSLIGDLMDAPTSVPEEKAGMNSGSSEVDLFADADFVSAPPQAETGAFADATFVSAPPQSENGAFADATFVSAPPQTATGATYQTQVRQLSHLNFLNIACVDNLTIKVLLYCPFSQSYALILILVLYSIVVDL